MEFEEKNYPILDYIKNNKLSTDIFYMLENSGYDEEGVLEVKPSFEFFINKPLHINYISATTHKIIFYTDDFINLKSRLKNSPETTGLLLLPETVLPDFSNVPSYADADPNHYPINAILYSWLSSNNHDKLINKIEFENLQQRIAAGGKQPHEADWEGLMKSLQEYEG